MLACGPRQDSGGRWPGCYAFFWNERQSLFGMWCAVKAGFIPFKVEREGKVLSVNVVPRIAKTSGWRRKATRQVMIQPAATPLIEQVEKDTPADRQTQAGRYHHGSERLPHFNPIALVDEIEKIRPAS